MKVKTSISLALLATCTVGLVGGVARADTTLNEDFSSYAPGSWPAGWVANANAVSDPSRNRVVADPTNPDNQVLRLYGTTSGSWGALAFADFDFPESYTINLDIRNGSEAANGVQPNRASFEMRHGTNWPAWTNPARKLLTFAVNGDVVTGDGRVLQTYVTERWYDVTVQYDRIGSDLTLQYWIDGVDRGISQISIPDLAVELSLDHVGLTVAQGSAYFDNLSVVPEPTTLTVLFLGGLGLLRRRRR